MFAKGVFFSLFSILAFARWDVVDQNGNPANRGACRRNSCFLKDSNTGLIWTNTFGRTTVLGIGGPSIHFTQAQAAQNCAAFGYRLPTAAEFVTARNNGMATAHHNGLDGFGTPEWFFWTQDPVNVYSLETPIAMGGQTLSKYKCVNGGGGGGGGGGNPIVILDPVQVDQQVNQTSQTVDQETGQFVQEVQANNVDPETLDKPDLQAQDNGNGTGSIGIYTPQSPNAQLAQRREENHNPAHAGQGSGADVGPNPNRISNAWQLGTDYFGAGFLYTLEAYPTANGRAYGEVNGKILRRQLPLVDVTFVAERDATAMDLRANARLFGNSVHNVNEGVPLGQNRQFPGKVLVNQRVQMAEMRFMLGPVPIAVKAGTQGEMGYRPMSAYVQLAPNNSFNFGMQAIPYAASSAWGSVAADIVVAAAGIRGTLNLVSGDLAAGSSYRTETGKACFYAVFRDVRMLNGKFSAFVEWTNVVTETVSRVIEGVCRWISGWNWGRSVCSRARTVTERVQKFTKVNYEKPFFNWAGRRLGNAEDPRYVWYNNCPRH